MAAQPVTGYNLFGGSVRNISVNLGINQNSTVVTTTVLKDGQPITVSNRQLVDISIGAFEFRGVVQSWNQTKVDRAGSGIYQVRMTDTKPVLDSAQVIIGSSFTTKKHMPMIMVVMLYQ